MEATLAAAIVAVVIPVDILAVIREAEAGGEVGLGAEVDRHLVGREIRGKIWRTIPS